MSSEQPERSLLIWSRMIRIAQKMARSGLEQLQARNLSPAQFDVLRRLYARADQTQQDLVEQLDVTRSNVTQLLNKLEGDGLIVRMPHGKSNLLRLTQEGTELVSRLIPDHDAFIRERFGVLSYEEQEQLLILLRKLDRSLL